MCHPERREVQRRSSMGIVIWLESEECGILVRGIFLGTIGHIFKKVVIAQNYRTGTSWGGGESFQLHKVKHIEW